MQNYIRKLVATHNYITSWNKEAAYKIQLVEVCIGT